MVLTFPWLCLDLTLTLPWTIPLPCSDLVLILPWPCPDLALTLPLPYLNLAFTLPWPCLVLGFTLPWLPWFELSWISPVLVWGNWNRMFVFLFPLITPLYLEFCVKFVFQSREELCFLFPGFVAAQNFYNQDKNSSTEHWEHWEHTNTY